jgi:predicted RecA/RadA family phage recombinase
MRNYRSAGEDVLWTNTGAAVVSGQVIVLGAMIAVAKNDIAAGAVGSLLAKGEVELAATSANTWTTGDVLYWNAGTAMLTSTAQAIVAGHASKSKGAGVTVATVLLGRTVLNASVADSVTVGAIAGSDASLAIDGCAAVQGGAVAIKGGTSSTTGNAGGAVTMTGGTPGATGVGGALVLAGAAGGATSGAGGAVSVVGGAGTNANADGGALAIDGGAPNGSGAAGAITIGGTNAASITLGKMPRIPVAAITAGGNVIANAANNVIEGFNVVAGADDTAAVKLPPAVAGAMVIIKTTVAGKNLIVFPQVNDSINNVGVNNAYNMAADEGCSMFVAQNAVAWFSLPLVSS